MSIFTIDRARLTARIVNERGIMAALQDHRRHYPALVKYADNCIERQQRKIDTLELRRAAVDAEWFNKELHTAHSYNME